MSSEHWTIVFTKSKVLSLQDLSFFDHLPPSSCKRSLWTAPNCKIYYSRIEVLQNCSAFFVSVSIVRENLTELTGKKHWILQPPFKRLRTKYFSFCHSNVQKISYGCPIIFMVPFKFQEVVWRKLAKELSLPSASSSSRSPLWPKYPNIVQKNMRAFLC